MPAKASRPFTQTLDQMNKLADSEFVRNKKFEDFTVPDLKKLSSEDFRIFYKKKIQEFSNIHLKTYI